MFLSYPLSSLLSLHSLPVLLCCHSLQIVFVKSYGKRGCWGFPKGKVNKDEQPMECAIREVDEETGYTFRQGLDYLHTLLLLPPLLQPPTPYIYIYIYMMDDGAPH